MTQPDPARQHIDKATALAAQAADDYEQKRSAAAANNTALAQVHALIAIAQLLAPEPEPDPAPEPEPPADPDPTPDPDPVPENPDADPTTSDLPE